jgi:hypothetical protein
MEPIKGQRKIVCHADERLAVPKIKNILAKDAILHSAV